MNLVLTGGVCFQGEAACELYLMHAGRCTCGFMEDLYFEKIPKSAFVLVRTGVTQTPFGATLVTVPATEMLARLLCTLCKTRQGFKLQICNGRCWGASAMTEESLQLLRRRANTEANSASGRIGLVLT